MWNLLRRIEVSSKSAPVVLLIVRTMKGRGLVIVLCCLHEKVMLIDNQVATVGTANFDNRSFRLNFEITAVVMDQAFALTVEQMFTDDFENSREMRPGELDEKGFGFRLAARLARLIAPVQ